MVNGGPAGLATTVPSKDALTWLLHVLLAA